MRNFLRDSENSIGPGDVAVVYNSGMPITPLGEAREDTQVSGIEVDWIEEVVCSSVPHDFLVG